MQFKATHGICPATAQPNTMSHVIRNYTHTLLIPTLIPP